MNKIIESLKRKIFLLLGRTIIKAINNAEMTQKIQVTGLKNEVITDIERFQEYGFETYPKSESEAFVGFLNGNRDHGIALCAHDRRYRPTDLTEGDVRVYNWKGNKITFADTGIEIEDVVNGNKIEMKSAGITITDKNNITITMDAAGLTLGSGDATAWMPNTLAVCPFTGAPHSVGIVKLKGA